MKNRLLTILLALLVGVQAWAANFDFTVDGLFYKIESSTEHTAYVTYANFDRRIEGYNYVYSHYLGYTKPSGVVTIPETVTYNGVEYKVTAIGNEAFYECDGLTGVEIPNTITSIGSEAFDKCERLKSIVIPSSVTSIGSYAFYWCSNLTSVTIPSSVTSFGSSAFSTINRQAFNEYGNGLYLGTEENKYLLLIKIDITNIGEATYEINPHTKIICDFAFSGCGNMTNVTIPSSVTFIDKSAFSNCGSLTNIKCESATPSTIETGSVPTSAVINIPYGSLADYQSVWGTKYTYGEYLEFDGLMYSITGSDAEVLANDYSGDISIPATLTYNGETYNVKSIRKGAFSGCNELTSVNIPSTVTSINDNAFSGCSGLTSITISEGVTSIGDNAFLGCSGLTSIIIPEGVTSIGKGAFSGCSGLTSVAIPEGVTSIGYGAFNWCSSLTSITIPEGVTSIGKYAFNWCRSLTSITIPSTVTSISDYAFEDCSSLTSITIPEGVTSIGIMAFSGCEGLTSITIPEGVTSIGLGAFNWCSMTSITIPSSVNEIECNPFAGCSDLQTIVVNTDNKVYDSRENCNAIIERATNTLISGCANTTIPSSVTSIGEGAFSSCGGLTSMEIPNSVTSISWNAFNWCGLESIVIPESVTRIVDNTFEGCTKLVSVMIPESVTSIGGWTFQYCYELDRLICLAAFPPTIGYGVFNESKLLSGGTVYIPKGTMASYQEKWGKDLNYVEFTDLPYIKNDVGGKVEVVGMDDKKMTLSITLENGYTLGKIMVNGVVVHSANQAESDGAIIKNADGTYTLNGITNMDIIEATFNKSTPTAIEGIDAEKSQKTIKTIEDGKIVIIRDGVKYDLAGKKVVVK